MLDNNYNEEEINKLFREAEEYQLNGDLNNALDCFKKARFLYSQNNDDLNDGALCCYLREACIYRMMQRADVAYVLFHLCNLIAKKINFADILNIKKDMKDADETLFKIIEQNSNNQNVALLEYFEQLLKVKETVDYIDDANLCYGLLARMADRDNEKELALNYLELSKLNLENYESLNQEPLASCIEYMGNLYTQLGKLDKAIDCYNKQAEYVKNIYKENSEQYLRVEVSLLRTYIYNQDFNKSQSLLTKVLDTIKKNYEDSLNTLNMVLEIADTYFDVKVFNQAIILYKIAMQNARIVFKDNIDQADMLVKLIKKKFKENNLENLIKELD